ncbi:hypothetical protein ACTFIY_003979 [Dictyostelium cf. discoideum]
MKILFILVLFIFGFKQQLTYCQVVCNGWVDSDSQVITTPCGENIENPCQTIDQAVQTCGNYDTINLYFTQTTKPFIISENGSFNSINNKTINLYNINNNNNNNQSIFIDLSITTKPFINIAPNVDNNSNLTNTININGFTFSNQTIQSTSIIKMANSNLNMNINNCNFLNNFLGQNGLFYFSSDPNVKNSNVGLISIVNSNFINNVGNNYSLIYSDYDSHIIIDKCLFKNISSNKEGAILDLEKGFTTITNSLFLEILLNNKNGGGSGNVIFLGTPQPSNDNYLITFDNITISDCFTGYGIVITSQYYTININNSKFIDNYNFLSIGVFNSIISDININNCIFQDNSNLNSNSLAKGGAISLINSPANISNSIFNLNSGNLGGAIYIGNGNLLSNPVVIIGCTFIDCKGTINDGDSIFINGSTLVEITNSTFTQSTQKSNQPKNSQVYCQSTSLLLSSLKFINQSNSDELLTCVNDSNCKIIEKSDKQYYNSCNPPNGKNDSDDDSDNNEHNHRKLTPMQIFGIVVGSIIVSIIIFLIVVLIYIKVKRNRHYIPIK